MNKNKGEEPLSTLPFYLPIEHRIEYKGRSRDVVRLFENVVQMVTTKSDDQELARLPLWLCMPPRQVSPEEKYRSNFLVVVSSHFARTNANKKKKMNMVIP